MDVIATLAADKRGVSTAVSYTLAMGITVVLVAGLLMSMGGLLDGQTDRAADAELRAVAEGIATELTKAHHTADEDATLAARLDAPTHIVGTGYVIEVDGTCHAGEACLRVDTGERYHEVVLQVPVEATTVEGGTIWVVVDAGEVSIHEARP